MKITKNKLYLYEIEYASGILREDNRQNQIISSNKKLKGEQFIVVEHIDCGVFIGKVIKELENDAYNTDYIEYRFLKNIDLSDWINKIELEHRYSELKQEMELAMEKLDVEKKYEYYASIDKDFNDLLKERHDLELKLSKKGE